MQVTTWKWINLILFNKEHNCNSVLAVVLVKMIKAVLKIVLQNASITTFSNAYTFNNFVRFLSLDKVGEGTCWLLNYSFFFPLPQRVLLALVLILDSPRITGKLPWTSPMSPIGITCIGRNTAGMPYVLLMDFQNYPSLYVKDILKNTSKAEWSNHLVLSFTLGIWYLGMQNIRNAQHSKKTELAFLLRKETAEITVREDFG